MPAFTHLRDTCSTRGFADTRIFFVLVLTSVALVGCSSQRASGGAAGTGGSDALGGSTGTGGTLAGDAACGGPVPTAIDDTHCASPDGGRGDAVGPHDGTRASDDDCRFDVDFSVPCIDTQQAVSFTVHLTDIDTTTPATGADPLIDGVIGNHPFPNTIPIATENDGAYTIGPVQFDRIGQWIVTFHFYTAIPARHSHASFYIDVP